MKNRISNLLLLLSLLLCLCGGALWFESYQKTLKFSFPRGVCEKVMVFYATTPPAACDGGLDKDSADLVGFGIVDGYAIRP